MAETWSALQTLSAALHWNRVMLVTLVIMGALTALGSIPDSKQCKKNTSDWQGWVWLGMVVTAALACFTELLDDLATEPKGAELRVEGLSDETELISNPTIDADCCNCLNGYNGSSQQARKRRLRCRRRCVAYGFVRFFSNCFIMAFALTIIAFIYLRDPSCWIWGRSKLVNTSPVSPNTTSPSAPETQTASPDAPWTTAPTEVYSANKNFSYVLFATVMALLIFVIMRILLLKYPAPKNDREAHQQATLDAQAETNALIVEAIQDAAAAAAVASEAATTAADAATTAADAATTAADASTAAADAAAAASDAIAAAADATTMLAKKAVTKRRKHRPGSARHRKKRKDKRRGGRDEGSDQESDAEEMSGIEEEDASTDDRAEESEDGDGDDDSISQLDSADDTEDEDDTYAALREEAQDVDLEVGMKDDRDGEKNHRNDPKKTREKPKKKAPAPPHAQQHSTSSQASSGKKKQKEGTKKKTDRSPSSSSATADNGFYPNADDSSSASASVASSTKKQPPRK